MGAWFVAPFGAARPTAEPRVLTEQAGAGAGAQQTPAPTVLSPAQSDQLANPMACLSRPGAGQQLTLDEARPDLALEGREWIEWRRRSWSEGDRWFDPARMDFTRPSLNSGGRSIDALALADVHQIVIDHNLQLQTAAEDFWIAVGLAWDRAFAAGHVRLRRDPLGGDDLVLYWDSQPPAGVLVEVHAVAGGWIAELSLNADDYPDLAAMYAQLGELERARLLAVREAISDSGGDSGR